MADRKNNALGPTGNTVRANLKRLREARGLTYQELTERLTAAGRPIPTLGLSRIEKGERRVDADDLVALAVVLNVNPSALLLPHDVAGRESGDVTITGAGAVPGWLAWGWADGYAPLVHPDDDPDGYALAEFRMHARPPGWSAPRSAGLNRNMAQRAGIFEQGGDDGSS